MCAACACEWSQVNAYSCDFCSFIFLVAALWQRERDRAIYRCASISLRILAKHLIACLCENDKRREWIEFEWIGLCAALFAQNKTGNRTIFTFRLIKLTFIPCFDLFSFSFDYISMVVDESAISISPIVIYHRDMEEKNVAGKMNTENNLWIVRSSI